MKKKQLYFLLALTVILLGLLNAGAWAFFTGWMSKDQEVAIGKDVAAEYEKKYGAVEDPKITAIGMKMVPYCGRSDIEYHFRILQTDEPNAMSIMGGFIYINRGLLKMLQGDESQVAFVLGHELAHAANRHMVKNVEKSISGGLILQLALGGSSPTAQQLASIAWELTQLGYSREEEYQADHFGAAYMKEAGYPVKGAVLALQQLQKLGGGNGPEFLMSHPELAKRISRIETDYPDSVSTTSSTTTTTVKEKSSGSKN